MLNIERQAIRVNGKYGAMFHSLPGFCSCRTTAVQIVSWGRQPMYYIRMNNELPDYDLVADALKRAGQESDAAECHGALCALVCTVDKLTPAQWLAMTMSTEKAAGLAADILATLGTLFEATTQQIDNPDFDFQLLIPGDDSMLDVRVEGISHWCQGFLLGLGIGGVTNIESLPGDLPELVQDFVKISRADALSLDDEEASESAFMEIVEYIRVGAMMFREEMKALNSPAQGAPEQIH
jgi:yecA family protein